MKKIERFNLDLSSLTKEEKRALNKQENIKSAKRIVLETKSEYWFNLLSRFPKFYQVFWLSPFFKKANILFWRILDVKKKKAEAVNKQDFERATVLRSGEDAIERVIIKNSNIESFDIKHFVVRSGKIDLNIFLMK
jgi:hypothetical protein